MRAAIGLIAGLSLLVAAPVLAQDDGYGYHFQPDGDSGLSSFAGLRGSLAFSSSASTTVPTATPTALRASYNVGGGGSVYLGTRLPYGFRIELEGVYRYLPLSSVNLGGAGTAVHGQTSIAAPMVNLMWDLPVPDFPFRPFIGAGLGGAYLASDMRDPTNTNTYLRNNNFGFAYEFMGGAEVPLSQSSRFTAMYRWMQVNGVDGACGTGGSATLSCKTNLNTQGVDLGLEMDL